MQKKIIHVDMDCFYAQVEMRDRPELTNVPLAIGGAPGTRSVLCTSNYIARKFGVKSAMPTDFAVRLCPKLVVLPPDFKKYKKASDIVQNVFLKLWKRRESLNNTTKLNSLLYKSVYNEFIDQYRQTKKVILLEKKHIDLLSKVVDEEPDSNFDKLVKTINSEIDNLPPKCKEVVILSKKEGLTNIEIAEFLKISIKSVESHITKAYKIIKDRIKK